MTRESDRAERRNVLRERIEAAYRQARDQGDERTAATLRLLLTALEERERAAAEGGGDEEALDDRAVERLVREMIDQRRADIARCESEVRLDEAAREAEEISVLERFLPPRMDPERLAATVEEAIRETGARSIRDAGRVMAWLKSRYDGQIDPLMAKRLVTRRLAGSGAGGP